MVKMNKIASYIFLFFLTTQVVFAQISSNDFDIQVYIGGADVVSPSTPVLLSVVPVASTQIDITWSASVDDYSIAGYVVERDGSPVATTTALNYSDAGLAATTTYSYSVKAFDLAFNYSSSSNNLATTTLENVVVPLAPTTTPTVSASPAQGTIARVVLESFNIQPGLSTTSINLVTAMPARIEVRWGKTASYEIGYVVNEIYNKEHPILLSDLEPGTKYNYEIIGYTPYGTQTVLKSGWFQTLEKINKTTAPANVNRFSAQSVENNVFLSWQLPSDSNFAYVRIVRSHLGFPDYPQSGAVVYQGDGTEFLDRDILNLYSPVYYTAFVYDNFGNVSSGAIALAYGSKGGSESGFINDLGGGEDRVNVGNNPVKDKVLDLPVVTTEATSSIDTKRVTVDMKMPQPAEITILQLGKEFSLADQSITLVENESFIISVPYSAVAGNLKSIIVSVLDPTDNRKAYSYLLRINKDQTAYEAVVAPMLVVGSSQIKLSIYDYEAFVVATYQAPVKFIIEVIDPIESIVFPDAIYKYSELSLIILGIIFTFLLILFLYRRRHEDNQW